MYNHYFLEIIYMEIDFLFLLMINKQHKIYNKSNARNK